MKRFYFSTIIASAVFSLWPSLSLHAAPLTPSQREQVSLWLSRARARIQAKASPGVIEKYKKLSIVIPSEEISLAIQGPRRSCLKAQSKPKPTKSVTGFRVSFNAQDEFPDEIDLASPMSRELAELIRKKIRENQELITQEKLKEIVLAYEMNQIPAENLRVEKKEDTWTPISRGFRLYEGAHFNHRANQDSEGLKFKTLDELLVKQPGYLKNSKESDEDAHEMAEELSRFQNAYEELLVRAREDSSTDELRGRIEGELDTWVKYFNIYNSCDGSRGFDPVSIRVEKRIFRQIFREANVDYNEDDSHPCAIM